MHTSPPLSANTRQTQLPPPPPHPLSPITATHVRDHPESRSSSPLMALLSGASLFMSLSMWGVASSCQPSIARWAHLLFYFMSDCLWWAKMPHTAPWHVPLDVSHAGGPAGLHTVVSEYDADGFYGTHHSLLTWSWMTVFTAHKWSGVHISGDMLKRRCMPLRPGCLRL